MRYFRLIKPIPHLALNTGEPNGAIFGLDELDLNQVYLDGKKINWLNHSIFDSDKDFFKEIFVKYKVGDKVEVKSRSKNKFGVVIEVNPNKNKLTVRYNDLRTLEVFPLDTILLEKSNSYWFYNSEGKICQIAAGKTSFKVLKYRKEIGNYFETLEEAKQYKVMIVKKETK